MNYPYLHIVLTHIPVVAFPLLTILLLIAVLKKNLVMKKVILLFLTLTSLMVIPVYLSGESAFETIETFPGFTENIVEPHDQMAFKALVLIQLVMVFCILVLMVNKNIKLNKNLTLIVLALTFFGSMSLIYTAYLGGKIRHTETRVPLFQSIK